MTVNQQMSAAWNGPESSHYVEHADRHDRQLAKVTEAIVEQAGLAPNDHVLDIGCGSGVTSFAAAARAGSVLGVDISGPLTEVATIRAATVDHRDCTAFVVADAQTHDFEESTVDVIISQFGLMFFDDPIGAFTNLHRALAPGGRIVFSTWRDLSENEWLAPVVRAAGEYVDVPDLGGLANGGGMFAMKHAHETEALLSEVGFSEVAVEPVDPPVLIGGGGDDVDDTVDFYLGMGIVRGLMGALDDDQRTAAVTAIRDEFHRRHVPGDGVRLDGAIWLVTATRGG